MSSEAKVQENVSALFKNSHAFSEAIDFYLLKAKSMGVSDIHFAPRNNGGEVRFRVSGVLQVFREIANSIEWDDLLKEIKRRSCLKFEKGFAQDSRFSQNLTDSDYRVSLVPVQIGNREAEQVVIRILPRDAVFSLRKLGLPNEALHALHFALNANQGLIVVTGPTGSGKTVTLMSALCAIEREKYSVLTLEDPVEYCLPGITQVQISEKLTFAQGLRAFLRQDPDYILVGETRDSQTANALIQAANTGHVVLTTLHTNSASEAFTRLASLGVDENLARENATFVCAQRLVPKLCPKCKVFDTEGFEKLSEILPEIFKNETNLKNEPDSGLCAGSEKRFPLKSQGCDHCAKSGVFGRALLFEHIAPVRNAQGKKELKSSPTLLEFAIELLKKGEIHASEVLAVL